jgi:thymidylate kinase
MRVAITGAHGVGKTTVLDILQEKLPSYVVQESATRLAVSTKQANFGTTSQSQQAIINLELGLFLNAPKNYFAPRHMLDRLAYSEYFMETNNIGPDALERAKECLKIVLDRKIFDLVFYIPIEFKLQAEGVQYREGQQDLTYQYKIDEYIKKYLFAYKIPFTTITGTPEERAKKILLQMGY